MTAPHCIVLAWLVPDVEVIAERRTDLGERPVLRPVMRARTAVWLLSGGPADEEKARAYAASIEGAARVYCYPEGEEDPLGRAVAERLAEWDRERKETGK